MPALRQLSFDCVEHAPGCLSALKLESLSICEGERLDEASIVLVQAALPHLRSLTHLALTDVPDLSLDALAALPGLRSLAWCPGGDVGSPPSGPWLYRLESLSVCLNDLVPLLPVLARAAALSSVGVACVAYGSAVAAADLRAVLRTAGRLPALHTLELNLSEELLASVAVDAMDALRHSHVRLRVAHDGTLFDPDRLRQLCVGPDPFPAFDM